MAHIITIINQKGGTAKTTTSINVASHLAMMKKNVLLIDFDPQANATLCLGVDFNALKKSMYDVLVHDEHMDNVIVSTGLEHLHLAPCSVDLSKTDINLADRDRKQYRLKDALSKIIHRYDYVLIDCPPSFGLLPVNALVASDKAIIPMVPQYLSLEGLKQVNASIQNIKKDLNPHLEILGILFCMVDWRLKIAEPSINLVKTYFHGLVFNTVIRMCSKLNEASLSGKSIFEYDKKASAVVDYANMTQEMMARLEISSIPFVKQLAS